MQFFLLFILSLIIFAPIVSSAQLNLTASTTLSLSICGNSTVEPGEQCDPIGAGVYSETIDGRQCNAVCQYGPYCGDGILQTQFTEECDDGNNDDGDFCSSKCKIEPAGSGGGGSSGGGSGGGGGSTRDLGDTIISIRGVGYPLRTVSFLLDAELVGTTRSDSSGRFEFAIDASPGTATLGMWTTDTTDNRSMTVNNTFDVTQGAITNINGVVLPPTLRANNQNVNPGDVVILSGQSVPNSTIQIHVNNSTSIEEAQSSANGLWTFSLNTAQLTVSEHTVRARTVIGNPPLISESIFSTTLQLFVGVDGKSTGPADLNRDGFINLIDFSILIFWWSTNGGDSNPPADISGNGRVGLEDFSIMLFNWTG